MITNNIEEWDKQFPWDDLVNQKLKEVFRKDKFQPFQKQCINVILSRKDLLVQLCSGYGKSLIYQLSSQISKGVTIVISPLISLVQDQVRGLRLLGIEVESTIKGDMNMINNKMRMGQLRILYTTPEKIEQDEIFYENLGILVKENKLAAFAIDEVHCITLWGKHFRNSYYQLSRLRRDFQNVPIIGLSATITKDVQQEIMQILGIKEYVNVRGTMNRPNLFYQVMKRNSSDGIQQLIDFILPKYAIVAGIVFCLTKNQCEKLADTLVYSGINAEFYHGGMSPDGREAVYERWKSNETNIIVATSAFGMGIDKSDVRFVIHYQMPQSIDSYMQESGRAGRDGKPATCLLMYQSKDLKTNQNILSMSSYSLSNKQSKKLEDIVDYCRILYCRRNYLLKYFDEKFDNINCEGQCDNCYHYQMGDQNTNFKTQTKEFESIQLEQNQDTMTFNKFIYIDPESDQKLFEAEKETWDKTRVNQKIKDDNQYLKSDIYKCEICQKIFPNYANLAKHSFKHKD